jgi:hypothetical protein
MSVNIQNFVKSLKWTNLKSMQKAELVAAVFNIKKN